MGLIYLDACLLIYFVELHDVYASRLIAAMGDRPISGFAISPLVKHECLVGPIKYANPTLQRRYEATFRLFTTISLPESVYLDAAVLRGRFGLRTPDALHLACAQHHRCAELWTHDDHLLRAGHGFVRNVVH